ncbi:unnamed protein product [Spirodela intermedia]|uniref:Methyltransferase n=1 Tax=Spirodela intermedia TaxID=51605 RepID=A0A7I8IGT6_SPIIN|nr:unnamed protein product [Spirodela intermedia]CAA6657111.1 unnamed protein product [Spirodela intermedia]
MKYMEYTPCHDPAGDERHCPAKDELLRCLIPAPPNYKRPFAWPQSRDFAWYDNIPHRNLSDNKAVQNWVVVVGDRFRFPGGGRSYLLNRGVLTMSFAPRDSHISQVQFALERGVPAMIGVVGAHRLPYPARAFDMAHCSRCLIPWHVEARGFWILSGPPINWRKSPRPKLGPDSGGLGERTDKIEDLAKRLCWDKFIENGEFAIWKKPINHTSCINGQKSERTHAICSGGTPDAACNEEEVAGGVLENWPSRASTVPPRITSGSIPGITSDRFLEDGRQWSESFRGTIRNVMDMNANLGGFAAALVDYPVWVMNVVPVDSDHWCEAFSTYPRTYDLLHADAIFSMYQYRCDLEYILLEMDRILRPEGTVLIRDTVEVLLKVQERAEGMKWKTQMTDPESGSSVPWKILVAVKSYWTGVDALETK